MQPLCMCGHSVSFLIYFLIISSIQLLHNSKTLSILVVTTRGSTAIEMAMVEESVLCFES